jgi:hypothetical protein
MEAVPAAFHGVVAIPGKADAKPVGSPANRCDCAACFGSTDGQHRKRMCVCSYSHQELEHVHRDETNCDAALLVKAGPDVEHVHRLFRSGTGRTLEFSGPPSATMLS